MGTRGCGHDEGTRGRCGLIPSLPYRYLEEDVGVTWAQEGVAMMRAQEGGVAMMRAQEGGVAMTRAQEEGVAVMRAQEGVAMTRTP